jgi:hypothetical protein
LQKRQRKILARNSTFKFVLCYFICNVMFLVSLFYKKFLFIFPLFFNRFNCMQQYSTIFFFTHTKWRDQSSNPNHSVQPNNFSIFDSWVRICGYCGVICIISLQAPCVFIVERVFSFSLYMNGKGSFFLS